jgi:hypothetical protein
MGSNVPPCGDGSVYLRHAAAQDRRTDRSRGQRGLHCSQCRRHASTHPRRARRRRDARRDLADHQDGEPAVDPQLQSRSPDLAGGDGMRTKGKWNDAWDPFFALDPAWTDAFMAEGVGVYAGGVFEPKLAELLSTAFGASITHMYAPATRRHIHAALGHGATVAEIMVAHRDPRRHAALLLSRHRRSGDAAGVPAQTMGIRLGRGRRHSSVPREAPGALRAGR